MSFSKAVCTNEKLDEFINKAQKLDSHLTRTAFSFVHCQRQSIKKQAVFWAVFYFENTNKKNLSVEIIDRSFPLDNTLRGKKDILRRAERGDWLLLTNKIKQSDSEYLTDTNAYTTLARSLVYAHKFKQAIEIYELYQNQWPENDSIDGEYIFTLIWAGDYDGASTRINQLRKYKVSQRLNKSLNNAEKLLTGRRHNHQKSFSEKFFNGSILGQFKSKNYASESFHQQTIIGYQSKINASLILHQLRSYQDEKIQDGLETNLQGFTGVSGLHFSASLGYLSLKEDLYFGHFKLSYSQRNWSLGILFRHRPLTFYYPMPRQNSQYISKSVSIIGDFYRYLNFKSDLHKEDDGTRYQKHSLNIRLPLYSDSINQHLFLIIPLKYYQFQQESDLFQHSPRYYYAGIGLKYDTAISSAVDMMMRGQIGLFQINSFEEEEIFSKNKAHSFNISLSYNTHENIKWFFNVSLWDLETQENNFFMEDTQRFAVALHYDID